MEASLPHDGSCGSRVHCVGVDLLTHTPANYHQSSYGTSTYAPGIEGVAEDFNVSREVAVIPLSIYVLGLALGPLIAGGLSETFGRRVVYLTCMPICLLFTLGAGFSNNIASLIICRLLAATAGAAPLAIGAGTIADIFVPHRRAYGISMWVLAPFLGPALGKHAFPTPISFFHLPPGRPKHNQLRRPTEILALDPMDHALRRPPNLPLQLIPTRNL